MILKTLDALEPTHGYGVARRIEQTSGHQLALNHGSVYPALLRLEQLGWSVDAHGGDCRGVLGIGTGLIRTGGRAPRVERRATLTMKRSARDLGDETAKDAIFPCLHDLMATMTGDDPPRNAAFKQQLVDRNLHRVWEELDGPLTDLHRREFTWALRPLHRH